jgi:hypothetical protein
VHLQVFAVMKALHNQTFRIWTVLVALVFFMGGQLGGTICAVQDQCSVSCSEEHLPQEPEGEDSRPSCCEAPLPGMVHSFQMVPSRGASIPSYVIPEAESLVPLGAGFSIEYPPRRA